MTASTDVTIEQLRAQRAELDGRTAEAKALDAEILALEERAKASASAPTETVENPAGKTDTVKLTGSRHVAPGDLLGKHADDLKSQGYAHYWCGVRPVGQIADPDDALGMAMIDHPTEDRPHPPCEYTVIGGISFVQRIQPVIKREGGDGEQERANLLGEIHLLREDQVERVIDEMPRHYLKWHRGDKRRKPYAQRVVLRSEAYRREAEAQAKKTGIPVNIMEDAVTGDMDNIAHYVYMVKVDGPTARGELPDPVAKTGIELP